MSLYCSTVAAPWLILVHFFIETGAEEATDSSSESDSVVVGRIGVQGKLAGSSLCFSLLGRSRTRIQGRRSVRSRGYEGTRSDWQGLQRQEFDQPGLQDGLCFFIFRPHMNMFVVILFVYIMCDLFCIFIHLIVFFFQSILRQANFKGSKLLGASFFDADLTGI